jgi:nitrite transporter NirC
MYLNSVDQMAETAVAKTEFLKRSPLGFWISSMMAGAYVGLGILLIFSVGSDVDPTYRALVMGCSFGIALTLVVFAGSDLFTGHTMFMTMGALRGRISWSDLGWSWAVTWLGNLLGCAALSVIFISGGGGAVLHSKSQWLISVAAAKMGAPALSLFARAILCNWLVCLAIWISGRMTSDAGRCIAIFWCLFGFIGSGYEHSVANMTLLLVALLGDHPDTVTWTGFAYNLFWVSLGNIVAGAGFMGVGYWLISRPYAEPAEAPLAALRPAE